MVGEVSALSEISQVSLVCVASGCLFMEYSLEAVEIKTFSRKLSGGIMTDVF